MYRGTVEHNKQHHRRQKRCKQAALNRTNREMWHCENNTSPRVCLLPRVCILKQSFFTYAEILDLANSVRQYIMGWITLKLGVDKR